MRRRTILLTAGGALAALAIAVPAQAAPVIIGSDLGRPATVNTNCNVACTTTNISLLANQQAPGGLTSPVDGVITTWKARGSSAASLRVLTPGTTLSYVGGATSTSQNLTAAPVNFATNLPIKAGDTIG